MRAWVAVAAFGLSACGGVAPGDFSPASELAPAADAGADAKDDGSERTIGDAAEGPDRAPPSIDARVADAERDALSRTDVAVVPVVDSGPACQPISCLDLHRDCGQTADGCGGVLDCGSCAMHWSCGIDGFGSLCVSDAGACSQKTCPNGCCDQYGACVQGDAPSFCGQGGHACAFCEVMPVCDPGARVCSR